MRRTQTATTPTYAITGGADAAKFTINSATGALAFASAPDFEVPTDTGGNNSYVVHVRASDGSLFDEQTITVNVTDVAPLIVGDSGPNTLTGTAENDTIQGLGDGDTLRGLAGADVLDGGLGVDTASYVEKTTAVVVTLNGASNATVTVGGVAEDTISNIENVIGGTAADTLTGDALDNLLQGGAGNDTMTGGGGNDTFLRRQCRRCGQRGSQRR